MKGVGRMKCPICESYIPQMFDHCPACGATISRELPEPKKQDMLILEGHEIPIRVLQIHEFPIHSETSGRLADGKMEKLHADVVKVIRKYTVIEDR